MRTGGWAWPVDGLDEDGLPLGLALGLAAVSVDSVVAQP
jgi:hypothetical protein